MKKLVKVKAFTKVLVFNNNQLVNVLSEGWNWVSINTQLHECSIWERITTSYELQVLIASDLFNAHAYCVDVESTEIVLVYENNCLITVLSAGKYFYWKENTSLIFEKFDTSKLETAEMKLHVKNSALMAAYIRKYTIGNNCKALLYINNTFDKVLESGTYYWFKNDIDISVIQYETRWQNLEISGQEFLTKDKANIRINFNLMYRIANGYITISSNVDYTKQLYVLVQLVLRNIVSALSLDELLLKKNLIGEELLDTIQEKVAVYGLEIDAAGIKDIILTGEMKDIMNHVIIAEKKAQANSIIRREETASTRSMLNTAKLYEENAMLWRLKEMEYVEKIAEKIGAISISGKGNIVSELREIFSG